MNPTRTITRYLYCSWLRIKIIANTHIRTCSNGSVHDWCFQAIFFYMFKQLLLDWNYYCNWHFLMIIIQCTESNRIKSTCLRIDVCIWTNEHKIIVKTKIILFSFFNKTFQWIVSRSYFAYIPRSASDWWFSMLICSSFVEMRLKPFLFL